MSGLTHQAARKRKNERDFEIANRLFFRLYQASNLMHKTGSRSVVEFSSTTQQWAVLGALSRPAVRQHGMTVKELIEFLLTSRQNLTAVLNRLERSRLIERVRIINDGRIRLFESLWRLQWTFRQRAQYYEVQRAQRGAQYRLFLSDRSRPTALVREGWLSMG